MTTRSRRHVLELIHDICEQYETNLKNGVNVEIGEWLNLVVEGNRSELFFELLRLELHYTADVTGNSIGDWFRKYPAFSNEIVKVFSTQQRLGEDESLTASNSYLDQIESGDHIGRFEIISLLGAGGFAVVYLAHDPEINQAVALKVLNTDDDSDRQQCIECLINEANVLSHIDHPMIPKVHDIGEDERGNPWVAMEFIKGTSLFELLTTEQLADIETFRILVKTARALGEIHRSGFTHRDIKPDNIIIGLDGEPRICDYGLALHEDVQRDKSGERAGTTCYMSPEQVLGRSENLDGRTDIWSLGVILYLVVAKRLPFHGNTKQEVREAILNQPVRPPRQIKSNVATIQLENVCLNALQKSPEERYPTADDFADAVQDAIDSLPVEFLIEEASRTRQLNAVERSSMRLAKQAKTWDAAPNVENLPGLYRYFEFLCRTERGTWTKSESQLMAAGLRHYLRLGALVAVAATMFVVVRFQLQQARNDERVHDVIRQISVCPINEVESTFKRLSSFAPKRCLVEVQDALENTGPGAGIERRLRLAMLSPNRDDYRDLFFESLLNAPKEDVATLKKFVLGGSIDRANLKLSDEVKKKLTEIIQKAPLMQGLEHIWPETPPELADSFRDLGGELRLAYAWCGSVPLPRFQQLCEELRAWHYRPVCVRPRFDTRDEQTYVSAIWHRSSADWDISYGISPEQFLAEKSATQMHLVDVSDGLESVSGKPRLIAVWADHEDLYGTARQMLLAERVPSLAMKLSDEEADHYGLISKDNDKGYLNKSPMLIDVALHSDELYERLVSRERQKIRVGRMIVRSCEPEFEKSSGSKMQRQVDSGKELIGRGWFALGEFERSSQQFQSLEFDCSWQDLLLRTRSLAMGGHAAKAAYSKSVMMEKMKTSLLKRKRPFLMLSEARAITESLHAELNFWDDRDAEKFIQWAEKRLRILDRHREGSRYALSTEFFCIACAAHSVNQAVAISPGEDAKAYSRKLKDLTKSLTQRSLAQQPAIRKDLSRWLGMHLVATLPFQGASNRKKTRVHSTAWTTHACNFEAKFIQPRSIKYHRAVCHAIAEDAFPVSIVYGKSVGGETRVGSVWHRELNTSELVNRQQRIANAFCFALLHNEDIGIWKVLSNPDDCELKRRIVETMEQFGIGLNKPLNLVERSGSEPDRVSILNAIKYVTAISNPHEEKAELLDSLKRIESEGSEAERELCNLIRSNLEPKLIATTTDTPAGGSVR